MSAAEILEGLRRPVAFANVPAEALADLASAAAIVELAPGELLTRQGEPSETMFVVLSGHLEVSVRRSDGGEQVVGAVEAGELVGEAQLVTGGVRTATVRAGGQVRLVCVPLAAFEALLTHHPEVFRDVVGVIRRRLLQVELAKALRTALGDIDLATLSDLAARGEWLDLARDDVLFRQGDSALSWYLVVSGSLVVVRSEGDGPPAILQELRSGALVGELAVLTDDRRSATVVASRASWVVKFDRALFEEIATAQPAHFLKVVREIVRRLLRKPEDRVDADLTVGVVPLSARAPAIELAGSLAEKLSVFTEAVVLDATECERRGIVAGPRGLAADHVAWMRLAAWLDDRHRERTMVLLVADAEENAWTRRVLAEANRVLLVGDGSDSPSRNPLESSLRRRGRDTPWEPEIWLVLTHAPSTELPSGTARWLAERDVSAHYHVRMGHAGDLSRLARFLGRRSVGIALSGGGARGFAHIGVVRSLHESGIPVDFFAGTSAGSLMGSLLAEDLSWGVLDQRIRQGVSGQGNPFGDYTLPIFALLRSRRIRRGIRATFGERRIEDLWIPCEIVATNLSRAAPTVFRSGSIWKAVLASASPPGATEPVVIDGELYCDGGVVDNVPLDLVEARGCRFRFVSSVTSTFEFQVPDRRFPSPWGLLRDKLFGGGRRTAGVPTIMEILVRATTLASDHDLPSVRSRADLFFEAPVDMLPLLDFSEPAAAVEAGRSHAAEVLEGNPLVARLLSEIGATPRRSG